MNLAGLFILSSWRSMLTVCTSLFYLQYLPYKDMKSCCGDARTAHFQCDWYWEAFSKTSDQQMGKIFQSICISKGPVSTKRSGYGPGTFSFRMRFFTIASRMLTFSRVIFCHSFDRSIVTFLCWADTDLATDQLHGQSSGFTSGEGSFAVTIKRVCAFWSVGLSYTIL